MIAIAIGPQNTLRVSGTIASTVAAAVSTTGRVRCTAASTHGVPRDRGPPPSRSRTWSIRITELRMIIPHERDDAEDRDEAERRLEHEQRGDDADQSERRGEEHHDICEKLCSCSIRIGRIVTSITGNDRRERLVRLVAFLDGAADVDAIAGRQLRLDVLQHAARISLVTDTPCSPSLTSARTVIAMSRLRRHSTGSSSS